MGSYRYEALDPAGKRMGGVLDASDNCPTVFNPIRPLDSGAQADLDGDTVGDACDPTPEG